MRRTTDVNFMIDRSVFADDAVPPITLRGSMELGVVLSWIEQLTGLNVGLRNEAVYISAELGAGDVAVRIYNVSDLISPVQEFPAPELAYQGGGGGDGFDLFGGAGEGAEAEGGIDISQIRELIEETIAPDTWGDGSVITERGASTLFISSTPEIHDQIQLLLDNLQQSDPPASKCLKFVPWT